MTARRIPLVTGIAGLTLMALGLLLGLSSPDLSGGHFAGVLLILAGGGGIARAVWVDEKRRDRIAAERAS